LMSYWPLLPRESFRKIFEPLVGKRIGFVVSWGNVGDWLIEEAAWQLFEEFWIEYKCVNHHTHPHQFDQVICDWADEFVFNGGGNMGSQYDAINIRKKLFEYKKPITIFPQTFFNQTENLPYKKIWVREKESFKFSEDAQLAPDLALGYQFTEHIPDPVERLGIFLRHDKEDSKTIPMSNLYQDSAKVCKTPQAYILLAARYERIVTNRLHFAIAGLLAWREVTLLPNSYFKNKAVWECWLKDLGCLWSETLPHNIDWEIVSFSQLGSMWRLGNQLFQYVFLRLTAKRLGVKFYCPAWKGQDVFLLNDSLEKVSTPLGIKKIYPQDKNFFLDFDPNALKIEKGIDIRGYFMSEKYFTDKNLVRSWLHFNPTGIARVAEKYKNIDFSKSCALHLRFTDMINTMRIYSPSKKYYYNALKIVGKDKNILVFSDDISSAKIFFKGLSYNFIFMENNKDSEDLYLMSLCHDCICSVSSFSWWGAWLNTYSDKIIICPRQRYTLWAPLQNKNFWPNDWIKIDSWRRFWNLYVFKMIKVFFIWLHKSLASRIKKILY